MGTLEGFPNPPAMVRGEQKLADSPRVFTWEPSKGSQTLPRWYAASKARRLPTRFHMGTLEGFPNPPAMVRGEQSSPTPHAYFHLFLNRRCTLAKLCAGPS